MRYIIGPERLCYSNTSQIPRFYTNISSPFVGFASFDVMKPYNDKPMLVIFVSPYITEILVKV